MTNTTDTGDNERRDDDQCCGEALPTEPWGPGREPGQGRPRIQQVAYSSRGGGFAFRPNCFIALDQASHELAITYLNEMRPTLVEGFEAVELESLGAYHHTYNIDIDIDIEVYVDELRDIGCNVELNYVVFNESAGNTGCGCGCGLGGSPVYGSPVYGSPVYGSPVYGSPVYGSSAGGGQFAGATVASPVYGSPVYGSPVYGSPVYGSNYKKNGFRSNTARPALQPALTGLALPLQGDRVTVIVLDTGIAKPEWRPSILRQPEHNCDCCYDPPDHNNDQYLDPASGHGTFVAGIIEQLAPQQNLWARRVLTSFGDGDVRHIAEMLACLLRKDVLNNQTILNMSFSGYADRDMQLLARAIRRVQATGAVVVASAGNDGTCRPTYPACLPGVIGVGALDANGPASYSNHGPWVRACAPGTDVVSAFYLKTTTNGLPELHLPVQSMPGDGAPDEFIGWARWSGTSFAAPVVTAALVRQIALTNGTAKDAVESLIDRAGLFKIAGLGTVVNSTTPGPAEHAPTSPT